MPDVDVEKFLKLLTFLPLEKISETARLHQEKPENRLAQHLLAYEFVCLAHGEEVAEQARQEYDDRLKNRSTISLKDLLVSSRPLSPIPDPSCPDYKNVISPSLNRFARQINHNNAPPEQTRLPRKLIEEESFPAIIRAVGLAHSRSEAARLMANNGVYVAGQPGKDGPALRDGTVSWMRIKDLEKGACAKYVIWNEDKEQGLLGLRTGKWNIRLVWITPHDGLESSSEIPPVAEIQSTGETQSSGEIQPLNDIQPSGNVPPPAEIQASGEAESRL